MADLDTLVAQHREDIDNVVALATSDLVGQWRTYDLEDASAAQRELTRDLAVLVEDYALMSGALGADFYTDARQLYIPGAYTARSLIEAPSVETLAGWAVGPLYGVADPDAALSRAAGGLQRLIANADRTTVEGNTQRDPRAVRHVRSAQAGACAFCAVMATREDTATVGFHRHCRCTAVPVFDTDPTWRPDGFYDFKAEYETAAKQARDAGEPLLIPNGRNERDTILWRIRENTGRK